MLLTVSMNFAIAVKVGWQAGLCKKVEHGQQMTLPMFLVSEAAEREKWATAGLHSAPPFDGSQLGGGAAVAGPAVLQEGGQVWQGRGGAGGAGVARPGVTALQVRGEPGGAGEDGRVGAAAVAELSRVLHCDVQHHADGGAQQPAHPAHLVMVAGDQVAVPPVRGLKHREVGAVRAGARVRPSSRQAARYPPRNHSPPFFLPRSSPHAPLLLPRLQPLLGPGRDQPGVHRLVVLVVADLAGKLAAPALALDAEETDVGGRVVQQQVHLQPPQVGAHLVAEEAGGGAGGRCWHQPASVTQYYNCCMSYIVN